jgi:hypothetical protein
MCFGGSSQESRAAAPAPVAALPPAPATPPPPRQVAQAPQALQSAQGDVGVRPKTSTRQRLAMRQGTTQLTLPLNRGMTGSSGGLNV